MTAHQHPTSTNAQVRRTRLGGGAFRRLLPALIAAIALSACGGGDGDGGSDPVESAPPPAGTPQSLSYSFPYNGQENVTPGALIRLKFREGTAGDTAGDLTLVAAESGATVGVTPTVSESDSLVALETDEPLATETEYTVRNDGTDLFSFTTAPAKTRPAEDGFEVVEATPGANGLAYMAFNTLRMRFSEPVDPNTVEQGAGFSFTDSDGAQVQGNLYVQGRNLVFDPIEDLNPGEDYDIDLDATVVQSVFGNELQANTYSNFTAPVRGAGSTTQSNLGIANPTSNGGSSVEVSSQLLGENQLDVQQGSASLFTEVSQALVPGGPNMGGSVMPMVVRRGGGFDVEALDVKFSGQIPAGISSGTLHNAFITDLSAYFTASPYDNDGPVGIRMNFDIAVYGDDAKGNGAFNQNVLNVEAVGTASTDGDGNLSIDSLGSFPVSVNGVDKATTDFRLRLQAPAGTPGGDSTGPTIVAQYPSACGYAYYLSTEVTQIYTSSGGGIPLDENGDVIPASAPEPDVVGRLAVKPNVRRLPDLDPPVDATESECADYLETRGNGDYLTFYAPGAPTDGPSRTLVSSQAGVSGINSVLPEESLSVTFSEPVDPASLTDIDGNPSTGTLQLAGPAGNVPINLQVQGSTVVIDPNDPLDYNTEYTLTVGTGVTDLAGNPLAAGQQTAFNTAPFVPANDGEPVQGQFGTFPTANNIIQTSPFLTTLYPGLPCALEPSSGDFRSGGNMAGYCVGNDTDSSAPQRAWGVFDLPANRAIRMVFSKPMQSDTITLANGCLTNTDGSAAAASNDGAVAVQIMDGNGNCAGVVDGDVVFPHLGDSTTRKANFRPAEPWQDGQRYWLVVCGTEGSTCTGGQTLRDIDDGKTDGSAVTQREADAGFPTHDGRLNTDPMNGTGTNGPSDMQGNLGYGFWPAAGGPDIVMPFDGAPASEDQLLVSELKPFTDVNGNGFADGAQKNVIIDENNNGVFDGDDQFRVGLLAGVLSPEERERPQPANRAVGRASAVSGGSTAGHGLGIYINNSGAQPASVGEVRSAADCQAMMSQAVRDMVGSNPGRCAPVTVHPGGLVAQTAGASTDNGRYTAYGRTLLHTAGVPGPDNPQRTVPQTGYIVDRCQGSYQINGLVTPESGSSVVSNPEDLSFVAGETRPYDYGPCFVLEQKLIFTADPFAAADSFLDPIEIQDDVAPQQGLTVNLVGPVSFERSGRLVIRATNTNNVILREGLNPSRNGPNFVSIPAGNTSLQLVGPAIHGGPLEAFKTQ